MPAGTTTVHNISCDNPKHKDTDLDPADPIGWILVTSEVYGKGPATAKVYCSEKCISQDAASLVVIEPPHPELLETQPEPVAEEA